MSETPPDRRDGAPGNGASVGNVADLKDDQALLPKFVLRRTDGLYVNLSDLDSPGLFLEFIERLFDSGLRFVGLDYACLQKLLYEYEVEDILSLTQRYQKVGKQPLLRLAADIVPFPPARRECYRPVAFVEANAAVEYIFEPTMIEVTIEEPVYGEPAADGTRPIVDQLLKTVSERTTLDVDEFIADMWGKGVHYGIDIELVRTGLASNKSERCIIAHMQQPKPGQDASVLELTNTLHRDNTPKLLPDGRVDLHQFQNRFPQVSKNTKLVKKIPRVLGKSGWDISGHELLPEIPRDLDFVTLAGLGTRVEHTAEGEFIVAEIGGFLQIDKESSTFSITEKIVNLEGVSLQTTGNLVLSGDEYEEHGEVHEGSELEGKHMTFMANVFGNILSHGGNVILKKNMAIGSIKSAGGAITVDGTASRATLEAIGGEITLDFAESCLIIGKKVTIARAIHCDILAEELAIEVAEGCAIAANRVHIGTATVRRDVETTISMLIPDITAFTKQLDELKRKQAEFEKVIEVRAKDIETLTGQPDLKNYSLISAKLRAKEITMTAEQVANWQKLVARVTPALRGLKIFHDEILGARSAIVDLTNRMQEIIIESEAMSAGIHCSITAITGDTIVRTLKIRPDAPPLQELPAREIRARLQSGADSERLLSSNAGNFEWQFSISIATETTSPKPE